jgi:transcriptional regulator with XRE-family HTH domain
MISLVQCGAARALLGWTHNDLAAKTNVPVSVIVDFESGTSTPPRETLVELRLAFTLEGCVFRDGGVTHPPLRDRLEQNERKNRKDEKAQQNLADMSNDELMTLRVTLNTELAVVKRQQSGIISRITTISNELRRRKSPGDTVDVSEHAVVRYLERLHGVNVREIRRKIRDAIPADAVRGDKFTVDGITYVISHNGRVTTLYEDESSAEV